ncbi:MAG: hypothetical protein LBK99_21005 [Opitutaceae bacterium]|jgi:hypothetical protein|nr:hypothetical protein [Opitutaceae bacterium]
MTSRPPTTTPHLGHLGLLGAALLALSAAMPASAATIILLSDDFSLTRPGGVTLEPGATIDKKAVQNGTGTWARLGDTGGAYFHEDGVIVATSGNRGGAIAIPEVTGLTTVQADMQFTATTTGWVAVGFQKSITTGAYGTNNVMGRLTRNGGWYIYNKGTDGGAIASGTIAGFSTSTVHTLALQYDPTAGEYGTLSLLVDGISPTGASVVLTQAQAFVNPTAATFFLQATGANARADNFAVLVDIPAIPEPSALTLTCALGALALALLNAPRRR